MVIYGAIKLAAGARK